MNSIFNQLMVLGAIQYRRTLEMLVNGVASVYVTMYTIKARSGANYNCFVHWDVTNDYNRIMYADNSSVSQKGVAWMGFPVFLLDHLPKVMEHTPEYRDALSMSDFAKVEYLLANRRKTTTADIKFNEVSAIDCPYDTIREDDKVWEAYCTITKTSSLSTKINPYAIKDVESAVLRNLMQSGAELHARTLAVIKGGYIYGFTTEYTASYAENVSLTWYVTYIENYIKDPDLYAVVGINDNCVAYATRDVPIYICREVIKTSAYKRGSINAKNAFEYMLMTPGFSNSGYTILEVKPRHCRDLDILGIEAIQAAAERLKSIKSN